MKKNKPIIKVLSLFAMAFLILTLGSCTFLRRIPQSQILPTDYVQTEGNSYIYGRFFKAHRPGTDMYASIGIVIKNLDTSKKYSFLVQSKKEDTVQILAVPPGNYQIESFNGLDYLGSVLDSKEFSFEGYQKDFTVALSTAVYLGDFIGKVDFMSQYHIIYTYYQPENKYENTTADLQEKFPFLKEANVTFASNMVASQPKVAVKEIYNNIIAKLFNSYKKFFNIEQPSMS